MMIRRMTRCALFAAMLCLLAPLSFPLGAIPVSLSLFAVMLMALLLPSGDALISIGVYLALGCVGLPVFAGFQGGAGALLGVTGGFVFSYPLVVLCVGWLGKRITKRPRLGAYLGCIAGLALCYVCGVAWYIFAAAPPSPGAALMVCVLPFLPWDILKVIAACELAFLIRKCIKK
jgi:biotin transport system substrate-specific component